jgi:hypothetical protein
MKSVRNSALLAAERSDNAPIRIPHPEECERRRPRRRPKFEPKRDRRDASRPVGIPSKMEGWHRPVLHTAADGGAVRINFTYRNVIPTFAVFGLKARRTLYLEGACEMAYLRLLETDPEVFDYQFQPATIEWETADGATRRYTTDAVKETADGVCFVEVKASEAYFEDPETKDRLAKAAEFFAEKGFGFEKVVGTDFMDNPLGDRVKEVFDDRLQTFSSTHVDSALELLNRGEGHTTLGKLHEQLSQDRHQARAIANALLVNRTVGFSLDRPLTKDTPVFTPFVRPGVSLLRPIKTPEN